jgi:hypothetical protein
MVLTVSSNFAMKCGNVWTIGLTVCLMVMFGLLV